jgi:hypothetical protein
MNVFLAWAAALSYLFKSRMERSAVFTGQAGTERGAFKLFGTFSEGSGQCWVEVEYGTLQGEEKRQGPRIADQVAGAGEVTSKRRSCIGNFRHHCASLFAVQGRKQAPPWNDSAPGACGDR